jgi:hypothetical protein
MWEFYTKAVEEKLTPPVTKVRRPPPSIGSINAPLLRVLTEEQMDEALFGPGVLPAAERWAATDEFVSPPLC